MATKKKIMIVNRKAPHGTIYAFESLEMALITAAFDQDVTLAFLDDGVYQLVKNQDTRPIETKNFTRAYRALPDYEIEKIYVERESLNARGLTPADLAVAVEVLDADTLAQRIMQQDVVFSA